VRALLDECVPRRFRRELPTIDVSTVADEGWLGRRNGDLLRSLRDAGFTHLITVDLPTVGAGQLVRIGV